MPEPTYKPTEENSAQDTTTPNQGDQMDTGNRIIGKTEEDNLGQLVSNR